MINDLAATLRALTPGVLGILTRRYGQFDACEDAVQEALLAASTQWPHRWPDNPTGWLVTIASRRLIETWRADSARRSRERRWQETDLDQPEIAGHDDTMALFFLCCHPALTPSAQLVLLLRAVGGLTTAEIARALLLPATTVGQRISRAKASIAAAGGRFGDLSEVDLQERLPAVRQALYLIFTEGHVATSGPAVHRTDLSGEAIQLARLLHRRIPADGEVAGLLALMLLTDARSPARTAPDGSLIPLAAQDRRRWNRAQIGEGVQLISTSLPTTALGPYQVQAAIAAVHDEAATAAATDWPQILALYDLLDSMAPGPMVTLNRIVAVAMVHGPAAALAELADHPDAALRDHHRHFAVRGHLLESLGDVEGARNAFRAAAQRTLSDAERRYLLDKAKQ